MTMTLKTEKLTENVGAEVLEVDLDRIRSDANLPEAVMDALEENGVLVFRRLQIDDETQVAFCRKLGEVVTIPGNPLPEIFVVSLDPEKTRYAGHAERERWPAYRRDAGWDSAEGIDVEREGAVDRGRRHGVCEHLRGLR